MHEQELFSKSITILKEIVETCPSAAVQHAARELFYTLKAGYRADQVRVPAGNRDGGQWARGGGSDANYRERVVINDPPIQPVYPVETVLIGMWGRGAVLAARTAVRAAGVARGIAKRSGLTDHGALRTGQRRITDKQTRIAIESAKNSGSVTTKIGKYGTPQNVYKGSNGITVIVETAGRNTGKVITIYRH